MRPARGQRIGTIRRTQRGPDSPAATYVELTEHTLMLAAIHRPSWVRRGRLEAWPHQSSPKYGAGRACALAAKWLHPGEVIRRDSMIAPENPPSLLEVIQPSRQRPRREWSEPKSSVPTTAL